MNTYNINGVPESLNSEDLVDKKGFFVTQNQLGEFIYRGSEKIYEIESLYFELRNKLAIKIFGTINEYHRILSHPIYPLTAQAGIDAEIKVSKSEFEKFIQDYPDKTTLHKILYFFDVDNLIGTLQNCVIETHFAVGEFYKQLNVNSFLIQEDQFVVENGVQFASGSIVTNITSLVNRIFISLYSILDFITKIVHEVEELQCDFQSYPKLKSKDTILGYSKKTKFYEMENTLFERTDNRKMVEYLRNEIVHNASIDSISKVYQRIENRKIVEKFLLLPDFTNGVIDSFKNRKRFFDKETKLNEILPDLVNDYFERLSSTLQQIKNYCS